MSFLRGAGALVGGTTVLSLLCFLVCVTTTILLTKRNYNTQPEPNWILVGGVSSTKANFRIRRNSQIMEDDNKEATVIFLLSEQDLPTTASSTYTEDMILYQKDLRTLEKATTTTTTTVMDKDHPHERNFVYSLHVQNLQPNTVYHYGTFRVTTPGNNSATATADLLWKGTFATPGKEGTRFNFTFATGGCAYTGSKHALFEKIVTKHQPLFFLHMGDFHYEDINSLSMYERIHPLDLVLGSSTQKYLYSHLPLVYTYDDHDWLGNDSGGDNSINNQQERQRRQLQNSSSSNVVQTSRDVALLSYQIGFPHFPLALQLQQQQGQRRKQQVLTNRTTTPLSNNTMTLTTRANITFYNSSTPFTPNDSVQEVKEEQEEVEEVEVEEETFLAVLPEEESLDNVIVALEDDATATANRVLLPLPIYQSFTIGTVHFILTDLLSESSIFSIYSNEQKEWFFNELSMASENKNYDYVIWVTTKPWIGGTSYTDEERLMKKDRWFGQTKDRQAVSEHISSVFGCSPTTTTNATRVCPQNLLVLSADAHMIAFDNGTNTYFGRETTENITSFPILQSGPLDRLGSTKGGPYSDGCYTATYERNNQYSVIHFYYKNETNIIEEEEEEEEPCLEITSYNGDNDDIIFHRTLCGKIFNPIVPPTARASLQEEGALGSCDANYIKPKTKILAFASAVLCGTISIAILFCSFGYSKCLGKTLCFNTTTTMDIGCGECLLLLFVVDIFYAGTILAGVLIPLQGYDMAQWDLPIIMLIATIQMLVVLLYIIVWFVANK